MQVFGGRGWQLGRQMGLGPKNEQLAGADAEAGQCGGS